MPLQSLNMAVDWAESVSHSDVFRSDLVINLYYIQRESESDFQTLYACALVAMLWRLACNMIQTYGWYIWKWMNASLNTNPIIACVLCIVSVLWLLVLTSDRSTGPIAHTHIQCINLFWFQRRFYINSNSCLQYIYFFG